jgi:hypothetical protein
MGEGLETGKRDHWVPILLTEHARQIDAIFECSVQNSSQQEKLEA